jgi:hypothetical protein
MTLQLLRRQAFFEGTDMQRAVCENHSHESEAPAQAKKLKVGSKNWKIWER